MKAQDNSPERRIHPRFLVDEGAMAFVEDKYGKIIDVSMEGLSFQYIENEKDSFLTQISRNKRVTLDIAFGAHKFCLTEVPIKIISEQEIQLNSNRRSLLTKRRCSLQFKDLTPDQQFLLKRFIILNQFDAKH